MGLTAVWITRFESGVSQTVILYGAILVTANLVRSRERLVRQQAEAARLNEQLSHARLAALAQQIQPHFLFNALNAIAGLMREGRPDDAVEAIATVSDCLRATLRESRGQIGELGDELDLVARYLDVQKLRFGDRMRVSIDVPQTLLGCRVPEFILQPLVDNAIKHGISRSARGGTIRICAARSDGTLALDVYNSGPPLEAVPPPGDGGVGLTNLRARLQALDGDRFQLAIRDHDDGVLASVAVPCLTT